MQDQLSRMWNYPTATMRRMGAATSAYQRYRRTIQRNLGYTNTGTGISYANVANMHFSNPRYQSIGEINEARVPTKSYMGLNNG